MTINGTEVLWLADGKVYTHDLEVERTFKIFDFLFEEDSNGNVNCYHNTKAI